MSNGATPPPTPPGTPLARRCFAHPDTPLWRAAVRGAFAVLTYKYYWDFQGFDAAQIEEFMIVARDIYYSLEDECDDMNCEELLACLSPLIDKIDTIDQQIGAISSQIGGITPENPPSQPYEKLPPTAGEKAGIVPIPESIIPGLTDEEFYGICISVVDGIVQALIDWFEELEAISNALELTSKIAGSIPIPIIGDIADAAADAAQLVDFIQETAVENFLAADTLPRRLALADKFYCKGLPEKALSMPIIGESLAEAYIGDLIDWNDPIGSLAEIATGNFNPEQIYYMSLGIGLAVWTVTGDFQGLITRASWRYWVNRGKAAPQSPTPDCGPTGNLIMRVRGTRYRVNGGAWTDLVWDSLGEFVDFGIPSLPMTLEVEDMVEPTGYMIIGESPSATAPIVTVSVSPEYFFTSQRDNPATTYHNPGEVASGSRIDVPDANRNCIYIISAYEV